MKKQILLMLVVLLAVSPLMFNTKAAAAGQTFPDVAADFWAAEEIQFLYDTELITGYTNGNFGPNDTIKRIQAASIIVETLGLSTNNRPNPNLTDVKPGDYGYDIIATVVDEEIMSGNQGKFNAFQTLSRAQMAKILTNAFQLEYMYESDFTDIKEGDWSYEFVTTLLDHQITTPYPDGRFKPNESVNRAQFSVFMARILDDSFKKTLVFIEEDATYEWQEDGGLKLTMPVYNNTGKTISAFEGYITLIGDDELIAGGYVDFSGAKLNNKASGEIVIDFTPEEVYKETDFVFIDIFHKLTFK